LAGPAGSSCCSTGWTGFPGPSGPTGGRRFRSAKAGSPSGTAAVVLALRALWYKVQSIPGRVLEMVAPVKPVLEVCTQQI